MPRRPPKKQTTHSDYKAIKLPISKLVDTKYREYAVYVLESRGIPSFYDALTPVQRYILNNAPSSLSPTLSIVGESIKDGYHHGDMSLSKAISKLARPFGCAMQILDGKGFFGSEVSPEPAAARYTKVKLANKPAEIIKKYKYLAERYDDGSHMPFWIDLPIGLTTGIVGIAVGYKTTILPRKLDDIKQYLNGERKTVRPYFHDFTGTIQKYNDLDKAWLIASNLNIVGNKIEIRELPPVMKYASAIKKLDWLFQEFEGKIKVINNSNTKVHIDVVYRGRSDKDWKAIKKFVTKIFSVIVTETPVFIKEGQVLVYDRVEDYLDDYKWQLLRLDYKDKEYQRNWNSNELDFNRAKKIFIQFILQKRRSVAEIDIFLKDYDGKVKSRLEGLTSKKFTKDELESTAIKIKELEKALRSCERALKKSKILFEKTKDPTLSRGISSKKTTIDLFDTEDIGEVNGITIWDGEDPYEKSLPTLDD